MTDDFEQQQQQRPAQHQDRQPGREQAMSPRPIVIRETYKGCGKLKGRAAFISGGDSGIGRAVAVHFAREGADVAIAYLEESADADETRRMVEAEGRQCLLLQGDCASAAFCRRAIEDTVARFGKLDILVNNAAEQHPVGDLQQISEQQLRRTFETNIFAFFFLTQAALDHMKEGGAIVNSGSVTSFRGSSHLLDYSSTKGAIQAFTFSLAKALADRKIRVNGVAPGPVWTPLIPASFPADKIAEFGSDTLMKRAGQPAELGPAYVFLASEDASFITGEFIHVNGGGFMAP